MQVGVVSTPTPRLHEGLTLDALHEDAVELTLPTLKAGEVVTMGMLGEVLPTSASEVVTLSQAELDIDALLDPGVSVSSANAPSGDGEAGLDSSDFPISSDMDYQSDSADLFLLVSVVPRCTGCAAEA